MASRRPTDAQAPFSVDIRAQGLGMAGDVGSRAAKQQRQFSENIATNLRTRLGLLMEQEIELGGRKAASSGKLVNASVRPENTFVDAYFVAIGLPKWLDKQARYWRTFEEGSLGVWKHPFVGTVLFAVGHRAKFPNAHDDYPGLRTSKTMGRERTPRNLPGRGAGKHGGTGAIAAAAQGPPLFVVRHEIAPANLYRRLYTENQPAMRSWALHASTAYLDRRLGQVVAGKDFKPPAIG